MKGIITSAILALPLALTALTAQANAANFTIQAGAPGHWENGPHGRVWIAEQHDRRVWIPGHWDNTWRGRVWVAGHYENR